MLSAQPLTRSRIKYQSVGLNTSGHECISQLSVPALQYWSFRSADFFSLQLAYHNPRYQGSITNVSVLSSSQASPSSSSLSSTHSAPSQMITSAPSSTRGKDDRMLLAEEEKSHEPYLSSFQLSLYFLDWPCCHQGTLNLFCRLIKKNLKAGLEGKSLKLEKKQGRQVGNVTSILEEREGKRQLHFLS